MSKRDVATPSLSSLAFILRNKELWPDDFHWDFWNCSTCAMGLAMEVWGQHRGCIAPGRIAKMFGMPLGDVERIFVAWRDGNPTPADIADRIDTYLVRRAHVAPGLSRIQIHAAG